MTAGVDSATKGDFHQELPLLGDLDIFDLISEFSRDSRSISSRYAVSSVASSATRSISSWSCRWMSSATLSFKIWISSFASASDASATLVSAVTPPLQLTVATARGTAAQLSPFG